MEKGEREGEEVAKVKGKGEGGGEKRGREGGRKIALKKLDARTDTRVILYSVQCNAKHWTNNNSRYLFNWT